MNNSEFSFIFRACIKDHIPIGLDSISFPELHEKNIRSWLQQILYNIIMRKSNNYSTRLLPRNKTR